MRLFHATVGTSLALAGLVNRLPAQDAKKPPRTEFSADAGVVNVAGNTSVTTMNANERFMSSGIQVSF